MHDSGDNGKDAMGGLGDDSEEVIDSRTPLQ
jgi:hypothetical protein